MAIRLNSLFVRMLGTVVLLHVLTLPLLFFGVMYVVRESHGEAFVDEVRVSGRALADAFETIANDDVRIVELLDSAMLSAWCVYAELSRPDSAVSSTMVSPRVIPAFNSDLAFGEHTDDVYFLSLPVRIGDADAWLRLGFDERPTLDQIERVRSQLLGIVAVYLVLTIVLAVVLSALLTKRMQRLRSASQLVSSGSHTTRLDLNTGIYELDLVSKDLDMMRQALVGANTQLQSEIRKREEEELKRARLETTIRQAQKIETIGTFSAGIAHEFNNILTPIILYLELAVNDLHDQPSIGRDLMTIRRLALRAKSLVTRILTFSHRRSAVEFRRFRIEDAVRDSLAMLRPVIPSTIRIDFSAGDDCYEVLGDPNEIQQLVVNLCNNAYLAMETNGGTISVRVDAFTVTPEFASQRPLLRQRQYIRLTIADDGVGMDGSILEHVFEPFYTTRPVGRGTGLGLSVVHGIVQAHGGDIVIRSELGVGTTVEVYLPRAGRSESAATGGS